MVFSSIANRESSMVDELKLTKRFALIKSSIKNERTPNSELRTPNLKLFSMAFVFFKSCFYLQRLFFNCVFNSNDGLDQKWRYHFFNCIDRLCDGICCEPGFEPLLFVFVFYFKEEAKNCSFMAHHCQHLIFTHSNFIHLLPKWYTTFLKTNPPSFSWAWLLFFVAMHWLQNPSELKFFHWKNYLGYIPQILPCSDKRA